MTLWELENKLKEAYTEHTFTLRAEKLIVPYLTEHYVLNPKERAADIIERSYNISDIVRWVNFFTRKYS